MLKFEKNWSNLSKVIPHARIEHRKFEMATMVHFTCLHTDAKALWRELNWIQWQTEGQTGKMTEWWTEKLPYQNKNILQICNSDFFLERLYDSEVFFPGKKSQAEFTYRHTGFMKSYMYLFSLNLM